MSSNKANEPLAAVQSILTMKPQVVVKTVSGSVASWPATGNVTTKPLPVGFKHIYMLTMMASYCYFDGRILSF